jgi:hypothetical protein
MRLGEATFLHVSLLGPKPGTHSFNLGRFATSGQSVTERAADTLEGRLGLQSESDPGNPKIPHTNLNKGLGSTKASKPRGFQERKKTSYI